MKIQTIKLPAGCTEVKEEEKGSLDGGSALPTAVKAVIAVGGAVALTGAAAVAAKSILSIFCVDPGQWIRDSMAGGQRFLDGAMNAGQSLLDRLMDR